MGHRKFKTGQSILEVVIALAIFALIAASFVSLTLGSFIAVDSSSEQLTATLLADDGLEVVRATRDSAWNELVDGETSAAVGTFTRTTTLAPVDLYQKNIKSKVDWTTNLGGAASVMRETRLTNWDSRDWVQTDWAGLPGQATWLDATRYASADATIDSLTVGELKLKAKPAAWSLFIDTGTQTWNDVFMISATDGFVVGSGGNIRRWNNPSPNVWNTVTIIPANTQNLNSVSCSSASNCFAVGASGTILRWTGGPNWSLFIDTGTQTWNDVFMISATDGFVVGSAGNIRRWNNPTPNIWNPVTSPTTQNLNSVYCSSLSNCYAMGAAGAIIKWNGSAWSLYSPLPTTQNLNSVFLSSPNSGWAVGASGVILQLTGGGFETSGVLTSSIFNMLDVSPVQIIEWDEQIPVCVPVGACNIKFQIRTGNSTMSDAIWPASPFNFTNAAGTLIPTSYNGKQYVQYQVQLNGDGLSTPVLNEVRINYK